MAICTSFNASAATLAAAHCATLATLAATPAAFLAAFLALLTSFTTALKYLNTGACVLTSDEAIAQAEVDDRKRKWDAVAKEAKQVYKEYAKRKGEERKVEVAQTAAERVVEREILAEERAQERVQEDAIKFVIFPLYIAIEFLA
ncbi:hypothetical protein FRB94_000321 [Tulasnella sp. JGI-2019a]|nr:hypothetical protein FRB94_000321 [Tulasnella sp. JGI-2019a]